MRCDCCQQESVTEKYDIYGMIVDLCSPCFINLQLEVVYVEGLDKTVYIQTFLKMGIVPK